CFENDVPHRHVTTDEEHIEHGCGLQDWWTVPCEEWLQERGWVLFRAEKHPEAEEAPSADLEEVPEQAPEQENEDEPQEQNEDGVEEFE
ncbi:unnamed protein product, partial [Polarella glacialis]